MRLPYPWLVLFWPIFRSGRFVFQVIVVCYDTLSRHFLSDFFAHSFKPSIPNIKTVFNFSVPKNLIDFAPKNFHQPSAPLITFRPLKWFLEFFKEKQRVPLLT